MANTLILNDEQLDVIYGALGYVEGVDEDQDQIIQQLYEMMNNNQQSPLDNIMGGNPVDNIPSVSYTYTDTPMAEEYYGGWTLVWDSCW